MRTFVERMSSASRSDPLEREAHRAAAAVSGTHAVPARPIAGGGPPGADGRPLTEASRAYFEPRFGHDFSRVRVHMDGAAARAEHAPAFTRGQDIVFGSDAYAPGTPQGDQVLAHELAHVVQQSGGAASGTVALSATQHAVQRFDLIDFLQWTNPLTITQKAIRTATGTDLSALYLAEQGLQESATEISIPAGYITALRAYAGANPADGASLTNALGESPEYFQGGWLLALQGDAEAITFGNSIFFRDSPPTERTFIHEMVHIDQYDRYGREGFLTSYFGLSLATILWRLIRRQPIRAMRSSPHENAAYALEARFDAWRTNNP